ncbi:MAG: hypothetical protein AB1352_03410 [Patescibacteria group bacterium]
MDDKMTREISTEDQELIGKHIDECPTCGAYSELVTGKIQLGEIPDDLSKE